MPNSDLDGTCGGCPRFRTEPLWKQALFFWRAGLWLGRCRAGCYRSELVHWSMPCAAAAHSSSETNHV